MDWSVKLAKDGGSCSSRLKKKFFHIIMDQRHDFQVGVACKGMS